MSDSIGIFNEESNEQHKKAVWIRELGVMIIYYIKPWVNAMRKFLFIVQNGDIQGDAGF